MALAVILTRAGLGLDPKALKRMSCVVMRLAFTPCLVEALTCMVASHFILGMDWIWGLMLGWVSLIHVLPNHPSVTLNPSLCHPQSIPLSPSIRPCNPLSVPTCLFSLMTIPVTVTVEKVMSSDCLAGLCWQPYRLPSSCHVSSRCQREAMV